MVGNYYSKFSLLFVASALCLPSLSFGGADGSGGGFAFQCGREVYLADVAELMNQNGLSKFKALPVEVITETIFKAVKAGDPKAHDGLLKAYDANKLELVDRVEALPISLHVPKGCVQEQLAIQNLATGQVTTNQTLYRSMSNLERAFFKVHEAYVRIVGLERTGQNPSPEKAYLVMSQVNELARSMDFDVLRNQLNAFLNRQNTEEIFVSEMGADSRRPWGVDYSRAKQELIANIVEAVGQRCVKVDTTQVAPRTVAEGKPVELDLFLDELETYELHTFSRTQLGVTRVQQIVAGAILNVGNWFSDAKQPKALARGRDLIGSKLEMKTLLAQIHNAFWFSDVQYEIINSKGEKVFQGCLALPVLRRGGGSLFRVGLAIH